VWKVFQRSLDAAIRNIETHPRGKLFRRLIEFGPHLPDDPKALTSDEKTVLSDPECGEAVEFIFSHMVNRFKGELAELLAIEPCMELLRRLQRESQLPPRTQVYWGEAVQEQCFGKKPGPVRWGKGADGLFVGQASPSAVDVLGIVEIKSMHVATAKLVGQIERHASRMKGGLKLEGREYRPESVRLNKAKLIRVVVVPSGWKVSREFRWEKGDHGGRKMVFPEPTDPPPASPPEQLADNLWKVTLAWSQEALERAAYEMTYGYMSDVGTAVFTGKTMPKGWEDFSPEEAGYNAIRMMLYYMPLRPLPPRKERLAVKLYNVYGFGYPLGVDNKEMMWPEDLKA
jgi:hypothetical protein